MASRHSYVQFYSSDWLAGMGFMPPLLEWQYLQICLYNWDKAAPLPKAEQAMRFCRHVDWQRDLEALIDAGKVQRDDDGAVFVERAMAEAAKAHDLWSRKSKGGSASKSKSDAPQQEESSNTLDKTLPKSRASNQNQNQNQTSTNVEGSADPEKLLFDRGIAFLTTNGSTEPKARQMIGKWKQQFGTPETIVALSAAMRAGASDPIPYITACLNRRAQDDTRPSIETERQKIRDPILRDVFDRCAAQMAQKS